MPRPEGYASSQFETVESDGKQVMVECRHCRSKKLARSVASRKFKHLQQCPEFHHYIAELIHTGSEELQDVPPEFLNGPQKKPIGPSPRQYQSRQSHLQQTPRGTNDSLPTLIDEPASEVRPGSLDPSLDEIRDWNQRPQDDVPMVEPMPEPPRRATSVATSQTAHAPERQIASAHRAAQRRKNRLDNVISRAVYEGSLPFNIFDAQKHPAMAEFFRLVDYTPPNRQRIADDLYDQSYDQVQEDRVTPYAS